MALTLPLKQLCNPSEIDCLKIILSSADRFPGLYRISSTFKSSLDDEIYMKWMNYFEATYKTKKYQQSWSRSEWLQAQEYFFEIGFGKNSRNEERAEDDLKTLLKTKYHEWYNRSQRFCLAVIDNQNPIEEIEIDTTYYMMGSLIRFTTDRVDVGWDNILQESYKSFEFSFKQAQKFINTIYSPSAIGDLFFKAEVVGHLTFDELESGTLAFDEKYIESNFHRYSPNSIVLAANLYDTKLPIQFAKPIGVTNVCR